MWEKLSTRVQYQICFYSLITLAFGYDYKSSAKNQRNHVGRTTWLVKSSVFSYYSYAVSYFPIVKLSGKFLCIYISVLLGRFNCWISVVPVLNFTWVSLQIPSSQRQHLRSHHLQSHIHHIFLFSDSIFLFLVVFLFFIFVCLYSTVIQCVLFCDWLLWLACFWSSSLL